MLLRPNTSSIQGTPYKKQEAEVLNSFDDQQLLKQKSLRQPLLASGSQVTTPVDSLYEKQNENDSPMISPADESIATVSTNPADTGKLIEESKNLDVANRILEKTGVMTQQGLSTDPAVVGAAAQFDLDTQNKRKRKDNPETYLAETPEGMRETIAGTPEASVDSYTDVYNKGISFDEGINTQINPIVTGNSDIDYKIQDFLVKGQIWDADKGRTKSKLGQALSVATTETFQEMFNKKDDAIEASVVDSDGVLNPELLMENIFNKTIDKIMENPNQSAVDPNVRTGFGGASSVVDPEVKSVLNQVLYNVINNDGLLEVVDLNQNDPSGVKDERLRLSAKGLAFYLGTRDILNDIQAEPINVSYVPGFMPGAELDQGSKARDISKRSKSSKNTIFENAVKFRLGTMPLRIDKDSFLYAKTMVDSELTVDERGIPQFLNPSTTGEQFSTGKWAKTLGIDQAKYAEFYANAEKRFEGRPDQQISAADQADKVMRMRMRHLLRTINDAATNADKIFYNKWFHATSVGRYFIRNTVLNSQSEKLVRNMVRNGQRSFFNVKTNNNIKLRENWSYIIGKNLLDPDGDYKPTGGLRTEDMTWNAILKRSTAIIDNPNDPTYLKWVAKGRQLSEALSFTDDSLSPADLKNKRNEMLLAAIEGVHNNAFKKKDDWGYKLQSYIDMYNYNEAKQPNGSGQFEPKAMVQHDGKQNGIAIQAMQLGSTDLLKLVGMIGPEDEDSVIIQGDIRDKFLDYTVKTLGITFVEDAAKAKFWKSFLEQIDNASVDRRSDLIKALSKTPLMETSYGMPKQFHMETALAFIKSEDGKIMIATSKQSNSELADYYSKDTQLATDLNLIIGQGLEGVLKLRQQKIYKDAGLAWAMMGGDVVLKGPLGTDIYMGANEHFKTGRTITINSINQAGMVEKTNLELTESRYSGSGSKKKRRRIYNKETGKYEVESRSQFGKLVSNQLPVLTVQQIDAAVMANTIMEVNNKTFENGKPVEPAFMIPVHDAIITDATSVDRYHSEINKQFVNVNKKYSISKAILNGITASKNNLKERAKNNPNQVVDVSFESDFRALHDHLFLLHQQRETGITEHTTADGTIIEIKKRLSTSQARLLLKAESYSPAWSPNGGDMRIADIDELVSLYISNNNIIGQLENAHTLAEDAKVMAFKLLRSLGYQYN